MTAKWQPILLLLLVAAPAQAMTYGECLALAEARPGEAFERATAWAGVDGGQAARHCAALALIGLGQFAEAADRLERLAEAMAAEPPQRQAEVLGQAANAWLAAGYAERAARIATLAVRLDPGGVEYYVDRAIAQAQMGRVREARRDLDLALELAPERADILALRASAKRRMGEGPGALADVERALRLMPDQPEALLERGHLRREAGDRLGARADWRRLIRLMPGSPAAEEAARALEALDLWLDRPEPQPTPQRR